MGHHNWIKYNQKGTVIEIIIRDDGGGKLDSFKFSSTDKGAARKVFRTIKIKYGIDLKDKKPDKDRDINWLK